VQDDVAELANSPMRGSMLYIDVEDIDAVEKALKGIPHVIPRRTTFYGADEVIVREPGGNSVAFAQYAKATA
jgi:hypothetical protein